jgi:hypothetical protein
VSAEQRSKVVFLWHRGRGLHVYVAVALAIRES